MVINLLKVMFKILKKIIMSFFFLFVLNTILEPINIIIPINTISITLYYFFGIPSVLLIIIFGRIL